MEISRLCAFLNTFQSKSSLVVQHTLFSENKMALLTFRIINHARQSGSIHAKERDIEKKNPKKNNLRCCIYKSQNYVLKLASYEMGQNHFRLELRYWNDISKVTNSSRLGGVWKFNAN